jgi:hypothetical protein
VPKVGTELGVELAELWLCGRSYLPAVAQAFLKANGAIAGTDGDSGKFDRQGTVPGTTISASVPGQVYPAWSQLRNELQRVMGQSAVNTYDSSDALVRVADAYAASDTAAAAEFKRQKDIYLTGKDIPIEDPSQRGTPTMPE